jgi:hypothetical protein
MIDQANEIVALVLSVDVAMAEAQMSQDRIGARSYSRLIDLGGMWLLDHAPGQLRCPATPKVPKRPGERDRTSRLDHVRPFCPTGVFAPRLRRGRW